jgi:hypothetical protein
LLERRDDGRNRRRSVVDPSPEHAPVDAQLADPRQPLDGRDGVAVAGLDELDLHGVAAQLALQLVRAALGDEATAVDDHQAGREPVRLLEVVRREEDGHLLVAGEALDLPPQIGARLGVEASRRLVEEQHLRPVDEAEGDVEPALHAPGVGLGHPPAGVGQAEPFQQLLDALAPLGAEDPVDLGLHLEVLATRRVGIEPGPLPDSTDRAAHLLRVADDVEACYTSLAAVWARFEFGLDVIVRGLASLQAEAAPPAA